MCVSYYTLCFIGNDVFYMVNDSLILFNATKIGIYSCKASFSMYFFSLSLVIFLSLSPSI